MDGTRERSTAEERILTLHPEGKNGVNIEKAKYDAVRDALLNAIPADDDGVALKSLSATVRPHLSEELFPASKSVTWYVMAVKQDLEARGLIEQVAGRRPQHLRRVPQR